MPFIKVSIDDVDLINNQGERRELLLQIKEVVAKHLSCMMPDGTENTVTIDQFSVRVHFIDHAKDESQAKDVEVKIEAIGFPDRLNDSATKAKAVQLYLDSCNPHLTFGIWLDLKPHAVWSE